MIGQATHSLALYSCPVYVVMWVQKNMGNELQCVESQGCHFIPFPILSLVVVFYLVLAVALSVF